jgi:hypothetical protein
VPIAASTVFHKVRASQKCSTMLSGSVLCRILRKSGPDPRHLGSCKILPGKVQEGLGMRLGMQSAIDYCSLKKRYFME